MGFWPFFWKKKERSNKQGPKTEVSQEKMVRAAAAGDVEKGGAQLEKPSHIDSKRRRTEKSAGLKEVMAIPSSTRATGSSPRHTPADSIGPAEKESLTTAGERKVYEHNPKSTTSVGQDHFTVVATPTLHAKRRSDLSIPRRKSSKRKAEDQARERELRAMNSPIPIPKRPVSYSEGPLRRDTKKAPTRLRKTGDRHASEVSLPIPESLSDVGLGVHQNSFSVNALNVLSPRPTIRYSRNPLQTQSRSQTNSRHSARPTIAEEDYSSKKRIDDLADSLDAGGLRELMERDQRRRERKRKTDQAKLEQKLKRRAEYEKEQETRRLRGPQNEAEKDTAGPVASSPFSSPADRREVEKVSVDPFFDDNATELELPPPPSLRPGSSIYTRNSQASFSPPTSPTQRVPREATPDLLDPAELSRRASEQGQAHVGLWASFFRRGGTRVNRNSVDRSRHASEEFSNTSRDSITKSQPQMSMVGAPRTFRRSGTPQRTQSKFREDLPELPLSPPDSRMQSPEAETASVVVSAPADQNETAADSSKLLATTASRATFDQSSHDGQLSDLQTNEGSTAVEQQTSPPAAALSRSLGSVDSEASWLSGKPTKRSSVQRDPPLRQSQSSLQPHLVESDVGEEADVADDPYFSRLSPEPRDRRGSSPMSALRKASSTALIMDRESDREGESQAPPLADKSNERWHSGLGRQPTIVRQAAQARSKEGLLNEYRATDEENGVVDDDASDPESPDILDADLQASSSPIFRAQSVNYGKGHIRHISAGSAKLLDIRRSSIDSKRHSLPRVERSSTPIRSPAPKEEE
jgi:hypothetical protein